jgi:4-hydroxybenzoate polyprenyltransferase
MYLLRYCIIQPMLDYQFSIQLGTQMTLQLPDAYFLILVLINILLGAGGYVINDYYDRRVDNINRPDSVVVDKLLPRRSAIIYHIALTAAAIVLAAIFAWHLHMISIFLMYVMLAGLFWMYSTTYKKQLFVGNLVVSVCTALIPLQVGLFEYLTLTREYGYDMLLNDLSFMPIMHWMAAFAFFAFIINLIREIVKDMEDLEGDNYYGCNTIPLCYGIRIAKIISISLSIITIVALIMVYQLYIHDFITLLYISAFIILPLAVAAILTVRADEAKDYHRVSTILKIAMLTGVLYSIIARQIIQFVV